MSHHEAALYMFLEGYWSTVIIGCVSSILSFTSLLWKLSLLWGPPSPLPEVLLGLGPPGVLLPPGHEGKYMIQEVQLWQRTLLTG